MVGHTLSISKSISCYIFFINTPSYDIYLIPDGFRGVVVIEYGVDNGVEKEYEGKWRIYRIPKSGILKTKFSIKGNYIKLLDSKYYYVDINGKRKEIKPSFSSHNDTIKTQVIFGGIGSNGQRMCQDFIVDVKNKEYENKEFHYKKTIDSIYGR